MNRKLEVDLIVRFRTGSPVRFRPDPEVFSNRLMVRRVLMLALPVVGMSIASDSPTTLEFIVHQVLYDVDEHTVTAMHYQDAMDEAQVDTFCAEWRARGFDPLIRDKP